MFVVVWEPKHGLGGGHQLALEMDKAEAIRRQIARLRPEDLICVIPADEYGAAAVAERGNRQRSRDRRVR
jgi:hypothetical protein